MTDVIEINLLMPTPKDKGTLFCFSSGFLIRWRLKCMFSFCSRHCIHLEWGGVLFLEVHQEVKSFDWLSTLGGSAPNTIVGRTHRKRKGAAIISRSPLHPTMLIIPLLLTCNWGFLPLLFAVVAATADIRKCALGQYQPQDSKYVAESTGNQETGTLPPNLPPAQCVPSLYGPPVCSAIEWEGWMRHSPSHTLKTSMWNARSLDLLLRMNPMGPRVPYGSRLGMAWGHLISWGFSRLETSESHFCLLGVSQ